MLCTIKNHISFQINKKWHIYIWIMFLIIFSTVTYAQEFSQFIKWGNAVYIDLAAGDSVNYLGKVIKLISIENNYCTVNVNGDTKQIKVARRALPEVINGVRIFAGDNRNVKYLTTDNQYHGLTQKDALLCLSDPSLPLLDPEKYTFPISRRDDYKWTMDESSHLFSYYNLIELNLPNHYYRSHEGIDFNMHDARGKQIHPLVAIESGRIMWVTHPTLDEGCLLLKSETDTDVYYVYKHIYNEYIYVKNGQKVNKGDVLAYIWGDHSWGHLHFTVIKPDSFPFYENRYENIVSFFPQMYELWYNDLEYHTPVYEQKRFTFGRPYYSIENKKGDSEYDDIIGYGWNLGKWCTAAAVEVYSNKDMGNIRLRKILWAGTAAWAENPNNYFNFEVNVENGTYKVLARVGDCLLPSWQKVAFEGLDAGTYLLDNGEYTWTPELTVTVADGKLTLTILLKDQYTCAGVCDFKFSKLY